MEKTAERQRLVEVGNAADQGSARNGWFIGHFIDRALGLRHSGEIEVKWGTHRAGESKSNYGANDRAKTLSILISGRFVLEFPDSGEIVHLEQPGDFALWPPGPRHRWTVIEDAVILTVRWPSLPGDQKASEGPPGQP